MRVMSDVILDHGLDEEVQARMVDETGNNSFWLGYQPDMDEHSDQEDPEATAKRQVHALEQERVDAQAFIMAVEGAVSCRTLVTEVERARMRLEDSRMIR